MQVSHDSDTLGLAASASGLYSVLSSKAIHAILGSTSTSEHEHSASHRGRCRVEASSVCANGGSLTRECVSHWSIKCIEVVMEARQLSHSHECHHVRISLVILYAGSVTVSTVPSRCVPSRKMAPHLSPGLVRCVFLRIASCLRIGLHLLGPLWAISIGVESWHSMHSNEL